MNINFTLASIISVVYFIGKFLEMRLVIKENKPLKDLLKETVMVYASVIMGDFILQQVTPIANSMTTENTGAFTNEPTFWLF